MVLVCEGEKDVDRVVSLNLAEGDKHLRVTATTNFDGAAKWRDEYSMYFAGRRVVVLPDNDESGRAHAEMVALSVSKYAAGVRIVALPGLPEKGDVSDWLDAGTPVRTSLPKSKKAPAWRPTVQPHVMLMEGTDFAASAPPEVEWLIEASSGGRVAASSRVSRRFPNLKRVAHAVVCFHGHHWQGFKVPRRGEVRACVS